MSLRYRLTSAKRNGTVRRVHGICSLAESLVDVPHVSEAGSSSGATDSRSARRCHRVLTSGDPGVSSPRTTDGFRRIRSTRGVDGRQRAQTARSDSPENHPRADSADFRPRGTAGRARNRNRGFRSGAEKVVSPATGDPELMGELPQVVPRSGRCHRDRGGIHGPDPCERSGGGKNPLLSIPIVGIHTPRWSDDDSRRFATIPDCEKKWQRPCRWIRYTSWGFDPRETSSREMMNVYVKMRREKK